MELNSYNTLSIDEIDKDIELELAQQEGEYEPESPYTLITSDGKEVILTYWQLKDITSYVLNLEPEDIISDGSIPLEKALIDAYFYVPDLPY